MNVECKNIKFEGDVYSLIYDAFNTQAEGQTGIKNYWSDEICLAAVDQDTSKLLGVILFAICGGQLWISQLYVMEDSRGNGIGKQLLTHAEHYAKDNNCDFIYLETMSFHNVEFYTKNGFIEDFKRSGFAGDASWIYMSKQLKIEPLDDSNTKNQTQIDDDIKNSEK